ncbi:MAG: 6-phosphogluconolactonase [Pararhizobium sp.]
MDVSLRPISLHKAESREALAETLAATVAVALDAAIARRGEALIAVSGGSTPKLFFERLSNAELPWEKVTITLVDERFVPPESDRSNHRLVAEHLLKNKAAAARFIPLYQPVADVDEAAGLAAQAIDRLALPFDVAILGMGADGHTASFFPHGNHLAAATDLGGTHSVVSMEAQDAAEPRLTVTLPHLIGAGLLILHIEGAEKMQTLERARQGGSAEDMPIRAVLDHAEKPLDVYWAA